MALVDEYAQDFDPTVETRGRAYFRRGAVKITSSDDSSVSATVQGTERYKVHISWDDPQDTPAYSCTCPYFRDNDEPCKHCWATVLQAEANGVLPRPAGWEDEDDAPRGGPLRFGLAGHPSAAAEPPRRPRQAGREKVGRDGVEAAA